MVLALLRSPSGPVSGQIASLQLTSTPGPVLAIVALCGGAGASMLSLLIGTVAAACSSVPVLACDTGGPTAGLAAYAGIRSPCTLAEASQLLADGTIPAGGLFAIAHGGLRLIAGEPQFTVPGDEQGLRRLLTDAQAAHGLTVIDAGTLSRPADRVALSHATHIAWLLPACQSAIERARRILARIVPLTRPELLIARVREQREVPLGGLSDLADSRGAPLVLLPHISDLSGESISDAGERAQVALEAIGGVLRR